MRMARRTRWLPNRDVRIRDALNHDGGTRSSARTGGTRSLARTVTLALLVLATCIGLAGPATAHNVLISSDPTDGATLRTAPATVKLTFDQPVQDFEPVVSVIGPDGQHHESGAPVIDSTVVTATVGALPVAGAYSIAYRVVSADGHPVEGEIRFQLANADVSSGAAASGSGPSNLVSSPAVAPPTTSAATE